MTAGHCNSPQAAPHFAEAIDRWCARVPARLCPTLLAMRRFTAAAFACILAFVRVSGAQGQTKTTPWIPSASDDVALVRLAVGTWPTLTNGASLHYISKSPNEMPPFDPHVFYAGADPSAPLFVWIWLNRNDFSTAYRLAQHDALMLAAMDSGAAGPKWQRFYDDLARRDAARHDRTDPLKIRHDFLKTLNARVAAALGPLPASSPDASIDAAAQQIDDTDIAVLFRGVFSAESAGKVTFAHAASLPGNRYAEYRGRDAAGNFVVAVNDDLMQRAQTLGTEPQAESDENLAALFEAAADAGASGAQWKDKFDKADDKARFGATLARAFDMSVDRRIRLAHDNLIWIHANVHPGATRAQIDGLLKTRSLTVTWRGNTGNVTLPTWYSLGCGREIGVGLTLQNGSLARLADVPESQTCL